MSSEEPLKWPIKFIDDDEQSQINFLVSEIDKTAKTVCVDAGVHARLNVSLVHEVYYSAVRTLSYLRMPSDRVDFYKHAGHLAFWICELKPLHMKEGIVEIISLQNISRLLEVIAEKMAVGGGIKVEEHTIRTEIIRQSALIDPADAEIDDSGETLEDLLKPEEFFINERVALMLALKIITSVQIDRLEGNEAVRPDDYQPEMQDRDDVFFKQLDMMARSLRYHNYSTRGMATMFEMALKTTRG